MEQVLTDVTMFVHDYWWLFAVVIAPALVGVGRLGLNLEANKSIAAVYRAALSEAIKFQEEGIEWLRGPDGVAFRKELARKSYHALPARLGPVPIGLVKVFVSEEAWTLWVDKAFEEMVELACELAND